MCTRSTSHHHTPLLPSPTMGSNAHASILLRMQEKYLGSPNTVVWEMQYARNIRMLYYIQSCLAVCRPACSWSYSAPQSSTHQKMGHFDGARQSRWVALQVCESVKLTVECSNCMHTVCNGTCFVREAAVCTTRTNKKYEIRNAAMDLYVPFSFKLCNEPVSNIITLCPGYGGAQ